MLGKKHPVFSTTAVEGDKFIDNFNLEQFHDKKYVVLFFYPADFSDLCLTEMLAFQERLKEFEAIDTQIVGCSTDSKFTHKKWIATPIAEGGVKGVEYPIIADHDLTISMKYGVLAGNFAHQADMSLEFSGVPMSYRATFVIDKSGIIRHMSMNELTMGRNIEDILRVVEGVQLIDQTGGSCPANWHKK